MKKGFLLRIILFCIPLYVVIAGYFILDPFKVIYSYQDFYSDPFVQPNRDHVSTELFLSNRKEFKYNSFIFGSSRTLAYNPYTWWQYLPKGSSPFVFDASNERVAGMYHKLKLIDSAGTPLSNVILLICPDVTFGSEHFLKKYLVTGHPAEYHTSRFLYHLEFFKTYICEGYFLRYLDAQLFHTFRSYMTGYLLPIHYYFNPIRNILYPLEAEKLIDQDPEGYYDSRPWFFNRNPELAGKELPIRIGDLHRYYLSEISTILKKHNTDYRIIISPLYSRQRMNEQDLASLKSIFDPRRVYDFSGVNHFSNSRNYYFENSHYRKSAGDEIIKLVYQYSGNEIGNILSVSAEPVLTK